MPLDPALQAKEGELVEKIQLILDRYALLTGDPASGTGGETLDLTFGNLARDEHSAPPRVSWIETGGNAENGRGSAATPFGTDEPEAYGDWVDLDVEIWRETGKECRDTKSNLLAAGLAEFSQSGFRYVGYERVKSEHEHKGVVFMLRVQLRLSVPLNGTGTHPLMVPVEHHHGALADNPSVNVRYPLDDPDP